MLVIGDIHGQDFWKSIVNEHMDEDYIVFVGDYFDSYSIGSKKILDNFRKIIKLKQTYPDKVKLLLGNHDIHYYYLNSNYILYNYLSIVPRKGQPLYNSTLEEVRYSIAFE